MKSLGIAPHGNFLHTFTVSLDVDFIQSSKSHVFIVALKIQNMHPKNSIKEVDNILYIAPYLAQMFTSILKTIRHSTEEAGSPFLCPLSAQQHVLPCVGRAHHSTWNRSDIKKAQEILM